MWRSRWRRKAPARSKRAAAAARAWKECSGGENKAWGIARNFIGRSNREIPGESELAQESISVTVGIEEEQDALTSGPSSQREG